MHRDMRADLELNPGASLPAVQRACTRWRQDFNHVRPHEALGGRVPADTYKRSARRPRVNRYLYPSGWITRTVSTNGQIKVDDVAYCIGKAFVGQRIALEFLAASTYRIWFRELDLGTIDLAIPTSTIDEVAGNYLSRRLKAA
jgi:hypothetical protein